MIGNLTKTLYRFAHTIKPLNTLAESYPNGIKITYPHLNNQSHNIESPLECFISVVAACECSTLKSLAKKEGFKLGSMKWTKIESGYDLHHWLRDGGPENRINDIYLEADIETTLAPEKLEETRKTVENLCPIYQMVVASGIKIHSKWNLVPLKV